MPSAVRTPVLGSGTIVIAILPVALPSGFPALGAVSERRAADPRIE